MKKNIYLDNAATTPVAPGVVKVISEETANDFGNASSTHSFGRKARASVEKARSIIAKFINASDDEIIFTSGGSESNNTVIKGVAKLRSSEGKRIITTKIEHPSVLRPMEELEKQGFDVVYLNVDQTGHISIEDLKKALTPDTILVSIMAVNNEVGSIMPIKQIGEIVNDSNALFHVDAVQGLGNIRLDVKKMHIDLMSTSGHKINGPKYTGFLYENKDIKKIPSLLQGGEQELKRRAGTENVPGIAGFGEAVKELSQIDFAAEQKRFAQYQKIILNALDNANIAYEINGTIDNTASHHVLNLWLRGIGTYVALTNLDLAGFAVSGGSACTAGNLEPSHVLEAMYGNDYKRLSESIRTSFGRMTTEEEVKSYANELVRMIDKIKLKSEKN